MGEGYEPREFWGERLERDFSLRGVGQWEYNAAYNAWLYRAKARALDQALTGVRGRALDVGSGVGWVVGQLVDRGFEVDGCDITDVAVQRLTAQYPASSFWRLAIGTEPVPTDSGVYDVVTMMDVAYHVTDAATWAAAVGEIARVLKAGGRLVATDQFGAKPESAAAHVRFRSAEQWREVAAAQGLELDRVGVLYRRLSRRRNLRGWGRLPDGLRGCVEFALDRVGIGPPTMRWAVLRKL